MSTPNLARRYPLHAVVAGARWLSNPVSEGGAKQVPRILMYATGPEMLEEVQRMRTHPTGRRILADRPDLSAFLANPSALATPECAASLRRMVADGADDVAIRAAAASMLR